MVVGWGHCIGGHPAPSTLWSRRQHPWTVPSRCRGVISPKSTRPCDLMSVMVFIRPHAKAVNSLNTSTHVTDAGCFALTGQREEEGKERELYWEERIQDLTVNVRVARRLREPQTIAAVKAAGPGAKLALFNRTAVGTATATARLGWLHDALQALVLRQFAPIQEVPFNHNVAPYPAALACPCFVWTAVLSSSVLFRC